ncbi:hypothetical protein IQ276_038080 [Desmonostoc muscorum LEGE 12446]|uniref:Uncharacterized protein n=1 Tax=Desmonostoc muscorum LEGE 12446 TaxID=1828758 RepID=A0A8J6ZTV2_DESMC|nr:hypothetical protein [Desmonostoc muscorum]MCF2152105.1 hypothetical protein [Desmonostoc muscorum LEGE 12446]
MANISITNLNIDNFESLPIQKLSEEKMQNIRGGALISENDADIIIDADGNRVLTNVIYSGEGLPWGTGGSDSDYTGA